MQKQFDISKIQNLGPILEDAFNAGVTAFTLFDRVSIPTPPSQSFTISTSNGQETAEKLEGVIVFTQTKRAYWPLTSDATTPMMGNQPDSSSEAGTRGTRTPARLIVD